MDIFQEWKFFNSTTNLGLDACNCSLETEEIKTAVNVCKETDFANGSESDSIVV